MASIKMLCIVFILTLFGEIRANVDSDALAAQKHVPVHQVLPPSLLYLLHSRPISRSQASLIAKTPTFPQNPVSNGYSRLPTAPVPLTAPAVPRVPFAPVSPVPPTLPVPPRTPVLPTPPVAPRAPVPPTPPVAPVPPSQPRPPSLVPGSSSRKHVSVHQMLPPSILYLLNHRPIRRPLPSQPPKPGPLTPQSPSASSPVVVPTPIYPPRISLTPSPSSPTLPPGQLSYDNPSNGNRKLLNVVHIPLKQEDPKPLTAVNTPVGLAPLPAKLSNTSQGEDLSPVPSDTTELLPIPEKPTAEKAEPSDSTNTITLNPKDLPVQPANSIEASPVPVRTNTDNKLEDLSPTPNYATKESPIPSQPNDTIGNKSDESPNTCSQEEPTGNAPSTPSQAEDPLLPIPKKSETGKEESNNSENTITVNPKYLPVQPTNSIEASPIPIRTNNDIKPEDFSLQPTDAVKASPIPAQPNNTNEDKSDESPNTSSEEVPADNAPSTSSQAEDESSVPAETEAASIISDKLEPEKQESNDSQNTNLFSPKNVPFQPISNIEASPIPVRSNNNDPKESKSDESSNTLAEELPTSIPSTPDTVNQDDVSTDDSEKNKSFNKNKPEENNDSDANSSTSKNDISSKIESENTQDETSSKNSGEVQNPPENLVLNGTASNTSTEQPQNNPLKYLIIDDTTDNKTEEDKNNSAEKSSNEAQSESSQEINEETNNGSSQNSPSNNETNSEESSNNSSSSSDNNESSNVSSEESDSSQTE